MSTDDRMPKDGAIPPPADAEAPGPPAEEAVGYGRPPRATRFKKGQSGNPRRRPKPGKPSSDNVIDLLQAEIDRTLLVSDEGTTKQATMLQVALLTLMRQAAEGNVAAALLLFKELNRLGLMKSSSRPPSSGVRRIPQPIATAAEFEIRFELIDGGRRWRLRRYREARMYQVTKQQAALAPGEHCVPASLIGQPQKEPQPRRTHIPGPDKNSFEPSIEEAFGPPADDDVGYGRPPRTYWFKKGQSGNPRGRPRRNVRTGSGRVVEVIRALINRLVKVRQGDKVVRMTLLNAVIRAFVSKAASGDLRAVRKILDELARHDPHPQEGIGWLVVPRGSLTVEESDAWCERLSDHSARQRTFEETQAYLKKIGRAPAPVYVVISGDEMEPIVLEVPEHLRPAGSS